MNIKDMPVYWRVKHEGDTLAESIPDRMNFTFDHVEQYDLIIQKRSNKLEDMLKEMYQLPYNIGYHQEKSTFGVQYKNDFMSYISRYLGAQENIRSILEIGCGGCLILSELQSKGYSVLGIDPSPVASVAGERLGIKVLSGSFPDVAGDEQMDMIFHVDVLEHILDIDEFLLAQHKLLNADGTLIVNVPDATASVSSGDISLAQHQHVNYFTKKSLTAVLERSGFRVVDVSTANYGGSLYAVAVAKSVNSLASDSRCVPDMGESVRFLTEAPKTTSRVCEKLSDYIKKYKRKLGFYAPVRAVPYLALCDFPEGVRFFDDTSHWQGGRFDGLPYVIEGAAGLMSEPPEMMCIMSWTFEENIRRRIEMSGIHGMRVTSLRELCAA